MNRQLLRRSPERSSQWRWRSLLLALLCLLGLPSEAQSVDESQVITLTTTRQAGQTIQLGFILRGDIRIEGAEAIDPEAIPHNSWESRTYRLTQSTVRVIGNLKSFSCSGNNVTAVDVSQSRTLGSFSCDHNELTELDLSRNAALTYLGCSYNQLSQLSVANNGVLETLICSNNKLIHLSLPSNGVLDWLDCSRNQLTNLDLSNQVYLKTIECYYNALTRLDINSSAPLRKLLIYGNRISKEAMDFFVSQLPQIDIPEANKRYEGLFIAVDTKAKNEYNHLSRASASQATNKGWQVRDVYGAMSGNLGIAYEGSDDPINKPNYALLTFTPDIVGQEIVISCTNGTIHQPRFEGAQLIRKENNPEPNQAPLYHLRVEQLQLRVDEPHVLVLKDLESLTRVDLSKSSDLDFLEITNAPNFKQGLDLRPNSKLGYVKLSNIGITWLELNQSGELYALHLDSLTLPSLNLSHQNKLVDLTLKELSLSSEINITDLPGLRKITFHGGRINRMIVKNCPDLRELGAGRIQLRRIEIENMPKLWYIDLAGNMLEELDMTKLNRQEFVDLYANGNNLKRFVAGRCVYHVLFVNNNQLEELDLSTAKAAMFLSAHINKLKSIRLNPEAPIFSASVIFNNLDLAAMSAFINALPHYKEPTEEDKMGEERQCIYVKGFHPTYTDGNRISKALVEQLKAKGWNVGFYEAGEEDGFKDGYEGDDAGEVYYSITTEYDSSMGSVSLSVADPTQVAAGTEVSVTATPAEGYELATLTANGSDITATKRFTLDGNTTVRATFRKRTYSVTTNTPEHGAIRITGANDLNAVPHGTTLSVEISPEAGYELATLTANGTDISMTLQFVVTSDTRVEATFREKPVVVKKYAVTLESTDGGKIRIKGKTAEELKAVEEGTELSVSIAREEGYTLASLTANGVDIMDTKKFVVTSDTRVVGTFEKRTFAIKLPEVEHATVRVKGNPDLSKVVYGTELELEITPEEGYEVEEVKVNGKTLTPPYRFRVDGTPVIVVKMKRSTYHVLQFVEGKGALSITGASDLQAVPYGTQLNVTATPEQGYELATLTANGTDISTTRQFVVTSDTRVEATFREKPVVVKKYAVTLESTDGGKIRIKGKTAEELKAVEEGTELSVSIAREEGYTLASLTANGVDIMDTKKFVVTSDTRVVGTFEKRTFAIKLPEVEHATVRVKGNPDLSKVVYGTELELEITPDEEYVVEEVKVNGKTLTPPYRFRVEGEVTILIKMRKTNAVSEVGQTSIRLYPNPATSYIVVEGVEEGEPLRLINLVGRVVLEQAQSASGRLSVSHLDRGVYLLQVRGTTHRVVLR